MNKDPTYKYRRFASEKIGRPVIKEQQVQFKRKYEKNERRFEVQTQLLVFIYEEFCSTKPSKRVNNETISTVFNYFKQPWLYEALTANYQKYVKDSLKLGPEDILLYTSTIDVCYLFRLVHQTKQKYGSPGLSPLQVFLIVLYFLHTQKLVNTAFLNFYCSNLTDRTLERVMFEGPYCGLPYNSITSLIVMLAIEVMDKERIMIERVVEQFEGFQVVEDPQREGQADGRDDREERKEIQEMIQEMPEKKEEDGEIY